jgi:hypothetical protein
VYGLGAAWTGQSGLVTLEPQGFPGVLASARRLWPAVSKQGMLRMADVPTSWRAVHRRQFRVLREALVTMPVHRDYRQDITSTLEDGMCRLVLFRR